MMQRECKRYNPGGPLSQKHDTMCDRKGEIMTLFLCPDFLKINTLLLCLTLAYIPIYCVSSGTHVYDEYHKDKNDGVQTKYF